VGGYTWEAAVFKNKFNLCARHVVG
jgi:hypothetical protein